MNATLARYAEVTRQLAVERDKIGRFVTGRPEMSLAIAVLVEERVRLATAIADEQLRLLAKGGR